MQEEDKTTREILFEVRRDVKWICLALQENKECRDDHEKRLRELELIGSEGRGKMNMERKESGVSGWGTKLGESCGSTDTKESKIVRLCAGIGAGAGGLVAVLMRLLG